MREDRQADGQIKGEEGVSWWADEGEKGKRVMEQWKKWDIGGGGENRKHATSIYPKGTMVRWREHFNKRYRGSKSQQDERERVGEIRGHDRWVEEWLIAERERQSRAMQMKQNPFLLSVTVSLSLCPPGDWQLRGKGGFYTSGWAGNYYNSTYCSQSTSEGRRPKPRLTATLCIYNWGCQLFTIF